MTCTFILRTERRRCKRSANLAMLRPADPHAGHQYVCLQHARILKREGFEVDGEQTRMALAADYIERAVKGKKP